MNGQAGKGDSRRPSSISHQEYAANYNRIFRKEESCGRGTTTEIGKSNPSGLIKTYSVCPACFSAPCVCFYR